MTNEEAIKEAQNCIYDGDALELIIDAIEKQIPKKPISDRLYEEEIGKVGYDKCPTCHNIVSGKYCMFCGQAINWSEDNELV